MISLLQRVSAASVGVEGVTTARIGPGLMVLTAFEPDDGTIQLQRMLTRVLSYRVFPDDEGRMNRSLKDIDGGLLVVPQFTLAADTRSGTRPGFSTAAPPSRGRELFEHYCDRVTKAHQSAEFGQFGADMQVSLVNDGPVTFWLHVR